MHANEILAQAKKLHDVSEKLNSLADVYAPIEEALTVLAKKVLESAVLLEVLVHLKLGPDPQLGVPIN